MSQVFGSSPALSGETTPSHSQHTASHRPANSLASTAVAPRHAAARGQHATSPKVPSRAHSGVSKTRQQRAQRGGGGGGGDGAGRNLRGGTPVSTYGQLTFPDSAPTDQNESSRLGQRDGRHHAVPPSHQQQQHNHHHNHHHQQQNLHAVGLMLPGPSSHPTHTSAVAPHAAFLNYGNSNRNTRGVLGPDPVTGGLTGTHHGAATHALAAAGVAPPAAVAGMPSAFAQANQLETPVLGGVWPLHSSHPAPLHPQQPAPASLNLSAMAAAAATAVAAAAAAYSGNPPLSGLPLPFLQVQLSQLQALAAHAQPHQTSPQPPTGHSHQRPGASMFHGTHAAQKGPLPHLQMASPAPMSAHAAPSHNPAGALAAPLPQQHQQQHQHMQQQQQQVLSGLTLAAGTTPTSNAGGASAWAGPVLASLVANGPAHHSGGPAHASNMNSPPEAAVGQVLALQHMPSGAVPQIAALHSAQGAVAAARQGGSTGRRPLLRGQSCGELDTGATHGETNSRQQPHGSGTGSRDPGGHGQTQEGSRDVEACSGGGLLGLLAGASGASLAGNNAHTAVGGGGGAGTGGQHGDPGALLGSPQDALNMQSNHLQAPAAPLVALSTNQPQPAPHQASGFVLDLHSPDHAAQLHPVQQPCAATAAPAVHQSLQSLPQSPHHNPHPHNQHNPHRAHQPQHHSPVFQTPGVQSNNPAGAPHAARAGQHARSLLGSPQSPSPRARPQALLLPQASRCNSLAPATRSPSGHPQPEAPQQGSSVAVPRQTLLQPFFAAAAAVSAVPASGHGQHHPPAGSVAQQQQQQQPPHLLLSSPPPVFALNLASGGTPIVAAAAAAAAVVSGGLNLAHLWSPGQPLPQQQPQQQQQQQQPLQQQHVQQPQPAFPSTNHGPAGNTSQQAVADRRAGGSNRVTPGDLGGSRSEDRRTTNTSNSGAGEQDPDDMEAHGAAVMADSQIGLIGQPHTLGDSACSSSSARVWGGSQQPPGGRAEVSSSFPPAWRGSNAGGGGGEGQASQRSQQLQLQGQDGVAADGDEMAEGAGGLEWQAHPNGGSHATLGAASHAGGEPQPHAQDGMVVDGVYAMTAAHSAAAPLGALDADPGVQQAEQSGEQTHPSHKRLHEGMSESEAAGSGPRPGPQRQPRHAAPRKSARLGGTEGPHTHTGSTCTTKQQQQHAQASSPNQHHTAHQTDSEHSTLHGSQLLRQRAQQQRLLNDTLLVQQQQQQQQQLSAHGGAGAVSEAGSAEGGGGYWSAMSGDVGMGAVRGRSLHAGAGAPGAVQGGVFNSVNHLPALALPAAAVPAASTPGQPLDHAGPLGPAPLEPQASISSRAARNLPSGALAPGHTAQHGTGAAPLPVLDAGAAQHSGILDPQAMFASTAAAAYAQFAAAMGSTAPVAGSASQVTIHPNLVDAHSTHAARGLPASSQHADGLGSSRANVGSRLAAAMAEGAGQTAADGAGGDGLLVRQQQQQRRGQQQQRRAAPAPVVPDPRCPGGHPGRGTGLDPRNPRNQQAGMGSSRGAGNADRAPTAPPHQQLHAPQVPSPAHPHPQQQQQPVPWFSGSTHAAHTLEPRHSHHHFSPPQPAHHHHHHHQEHSDIGSTHRGAGGPPQGHNAAAHGHMVHSHSGNMSPPHPHHPHHPHPHHPHQHHHHHQQQQLHSQPLQAGSHQVVGPAAFGEPPAQSDSNQTLPEAVPNGGGGGGCSSQEGTAAVSGLAMSDAHATAHGAAMGAHGWGCTTSGGPQDGEVQQPEQTGEDSNGFFTALEPGAMHPPSDRTGQQRRQAAPRAQQQHHHHHHHHTTQVHPQHDTQAQSGHATHAQQHPPHHPHYQQQQQQQHNDADHSAAGSPPPPDEFQQHESHALLGPVVASYYQQYLCHQQAGSSAPAPLPQAPLAAPLQSNPTASGGGQYLPPGPATDLAHHEAGSSGGG
ncbi:MAG: hypothetical protein WDW36_004017 [Sanguina aurantia]